MGEASIQGNRSISLDSGIHKFYIQTKGFHICLPVVEFDNTSYLHKKK